MMWETLNVYMGIYNPHCDSGLFENDLKPFLATVIGDIDDKSVVSFMLVLCSMRQIDKPILAQTCLAVWINARRWKI